MKESGGWLRFVGKDSVTHTSDIEYKAVFLVDVTTGTFSTWHYTSDIEWRSARKQYGSQNLAIITPSRYPPRITESTTDGVICRTSAHSSRYITFADPSSRSNMIVLGMRIGLGR